MRSVHDIGREMLERIKEELDLPSGTPGYIFWAQGPKALREVLEGFLREEHLTPSQAQALRRLLPAVEQRGLTLLVLVPWGDRVYVGGSQAELVVPLKG